VSWCGISLEYNTTFSQTEAVEFVKLSRLDIVGDHFLNDAFVRNFTFPALTALSIKIPGGRVYGVPDLLSTLNGEDQTLKELLQVKDDDYVVEMSPELLDQLAQFNQLETCRLLGAVLFTPLG
jgi:hypothetical protein